MKSALIIYNGSSCPLPNKPLHIVVLVPTNHLITKLTFCCRSSFPPGVNRVNVTDFAPCTVRHTSSSKYAAGVNLGLMMMLSLK